MNMVLRIILLFALGLLCTQTWGYANSPIYAYDASGYSYIDQNISSGTIKPGYDSGQKFLKPVDHPQANSIARGNRKTIRNPPGKDLAHERGREAAKGYGYKRISKRISKSKRIRGHKRIRGQVLPFAFIKIIGLITK